MATLSTTTLCCLSFPSSIYIPERHPQKEGFWDKTPTHLCTPLMQTPGLLSQKDWSTRTYYMYWRRVVKVTRHCVVLSLKDGHGYSLGLPANFAEQRVFSTCLPSNGQSCERGLTTFFLDCCHHYPSLTPCWLMKKKREHYQWILAEVYTGWQLWANWFNRLLFQLAT